MCVVCLGNNGHQGSITCLDSYSSNPSDNNATLISGSTDGMMNVYNLEKGKVRAAPILSCTGNPSSHITMRLFYG